MNDSCTTALTPQLKPFEVLIFSTEGARFSWLKQHILKYFEDWFTAIEVRRWVYGKNKKCLCNSKSKKGVKITLHTVIELAYKIFDYSYVLAKRISRGEIHYKLTSAKNILSEFGKISYTSMTLVVSTLFESQKHSSQITTSNVREKTQILNHR